ncbi:hypothetical protein [uncultured Tateyamaria sp.]|nr:hypothetical protein [uncultured Tateyamaria sp.]
MALTRVGALPQTPKFTWQDEGDCPHVYVGAEEGIIKELPQCPNI